MMNVCSKFLVAVALVACGSATARRQVELMPRDNLDFEGDRTPTESYSRASGSDTFSGRKNHDSKLMLGAGITTLTNRPQGNETVTHTIYAAVGAETHQGYIGGDLDLFFGSAAVDLNNQGGVVQQRSGSLKQYGGMFDLTGELPIDLGGFLILPRAGIGYGVQHLALTRDLGLNAGRTNFGVGVGARETIHGAFAVGGVILRPVRFLTLSADYSASFFTDGSISGNGAGIEIPLGNGASDFDRIRASIFFRLSRTFYLGGQFVQRSINFNIPVALDPNGILSPKQRHFLGLIGIEL